MAFGAVRLELFPVYIFGMLERQSPHGDLPLGQIVALGEDRVADRAVFGDRLSCSRLQRRAVTAEAAEELAEAAEELRESGIREYAAEEGITYEEAKTRIQGKPKRKHKAKKPVAVS